MSDPRLDPGVLGIFDGVDAAALSIEQLRAADYRMITAFSPVPSHEIEEALGAPESPVRLFTLVGGLTGAAVGFLLPTWTSINWPLVTGGKPIISIPAWVIIAFELTILFGALATVAGLFINARLPRTRLEQVYDPSFAGGHFGVLVRAPADRAVDAAAIMRENGAYEVREQVTEVQVGTLR
jgi:hypothetical protein